MTLQFYSRENSSPRQRRGFVYQQSESQPGASFCCPPLAVNDSRRTIKTCDLMRETKINSSDCLRTIMQSIDYWAEVIVDVCDIFQGFAGGDSREFRVALLAHFAGECRLTESPNSPTPEPCFTLFRHTIKQADKEREFISFKFIQRQKKLLYWLIGWASVKKQEEELQKQHRLLIWKLNEKSRSDHLLTAPIIAMRWELLDWWGFRLMSGNIYSASDESSLHSRFTRLEPDKSMLSGDTRVLIISFYDTISSARVSCCDGNWNENCDAERWWLALLWRFMALASDTRRICDDALR